jgi:amino-acid N-acetyltransferase
MQSVKEALGSTRWQIEAELSTGLPNSPMHGAKIKAIGGNFITAKPIGILNGVDYQHTGEVRGIDAESIQQQLQFGGLVLISSIGFSPTGEAFNLSYQEVAAKTAIAINAEKLILVTEMAGILEDKNLIRSLSMPEAKSLLKKSNNSPQNKLLDTACSACSEGVKRVHLVSCAEDGALLTELFTRNGSGTLVMQDHSDVIRAAGIDDVGGILDLIAPLEEQQILVKRSRELLETEISQFTLVVHPEGNLLGCAALYPIADSNDGEIACMATDPEFLGQGIASRLLERLEADAVKMGIKKLFVLTTQAAHWFLEKGFVETELKDLPQQKQSLYNYQRNSQILVKILN